MQQPRQLRRILHRLAFDLVHQEIDETGQLRRDCRVIMTNPEYYRKIILPRLPLPSLPGSLTLIEEMYQGTDVIFIWSCLRQQWIRRRGVNDVNPLLCKLNIKIRSVSTERLYPAHQPAPMPMDLEDPINQKNGVTNQPLSDPSQETLTPTQLLRQNEQTTQKECERSKCQRLEKEIKRLRKERNGYKKKLEVEKKKMEFWHAKREKVKKEREDLKGEVEFRRAEIERLRKENEELERMGYSVDVSPPLTPAGSVKE
ncbi:unnamed protein product [Caenorhabditis nigoni]